MRRNQRQFKAFSDIDMIEDYASEAIRILFCGGIIEGKPNNIFDPKGNATRAEGAAVVRRFAER